ncbi:MAG: VWA domain-containing protein [Parvibaculaceae bacterium]
MTAAKPPVGRSGRPPEVQSGSAGSEIEAFLAKARAMTPATGAGRGRLVFAMDATMSRQPTWDRALNIQAEMFFETARIGGLDVQLVYFRGFRECQASRWVSDPEGLARLMTKVNCRGGNTQIGRVLTHVLKESKAGKVSAVVYVGDCMEEEVDALCRKAGEIGLLGTPVFMFQEGFEPVAEQAFREIARLTGGAYCRFDSASARQLRDLLSAVAVYAAGGRPALADYSRAGGSGARLLLEQMG